MKHLRRSPEQTFGARVGYRIDRFLGLHPGVQLASVLLALTVLALFLGAIVSALDAAMGVSKSCQDQPNCAADGVSGGFWWAITRMLDGGTVGSDTGSGFVRQVFGLGVTLVGLVSVTVLTGAFASSFSERLAAIRRGTLPVFERGHVLLLGWNANAAIIVRELARSRRRARIVIVADHDRDELEERIRGILEGWSHHLDVVVRRGDPTTAAAVRRASARRARAVMILPDTESTHCADRAALRSLLALERVLGDAQARPHVIVEVASENGRSMVGLCDRPGKSGAGAHRDVVVVQAYEANAHVVAQAVRYRGAFSVVRQILALDSVAIYVYPAKKLAGLTFDHAHFGLESGVLIGLVRDGEPRVAPEGGLVIEAGDQLLVANDRDAAPRICERLAAAMPEPHRASKGGADPVRVLVLRYRSELVTILDFLDERGAVHATLLAPAAQIARAREAIDRAELAGTTVDLVEGDPLDGPTIDRVLARGYDVALLLAPDVAATAVPEADADQLISLLQLHRARDDGKTDTLDHVVIEVRSPEAKLPKQLSHRDGFIMSREIVGMLLARELDAAAFGGSTNYHAILEAFTPAVQLEPAERYADGEPAPTFGALMAGARRRGEVAIGVAIDRSTPRLFPPRDEAIVAASARLVVLHPRPRGRTNVPAPPPSGRAFL